MKLHLISAENEDDQVDVTPLLDVIFLLVLFFMLTSRFIDEGDKKEETIEVNLPKAEIAREVERDDVHEICIRKNGRIYLDRNAVTMARLQRLLPRDETVKPIVLRCDRSTPYERVVQVKNLLVNAGIETIFEEVSTDE